MVGTILYTGEECVEDIDWVRSNTLHLQYPSLQNITRRALFQGKQ